MSRVLTRLKILKSRIHALINRPNAEALLFTDISATIQTAIPSSQILGSSVSAIQAIQQQIYW